MCETVTLNHRKIGFMVSVEKVLILSKYLSPFGIMPFHKYLKSHICFTGLLSGTQSYYFNLTFSVRTFKCQSSPAGRTFLGI